MALALKLNCKVLITQNLSNGLVNGLTGTVTNMTEDIIQVKIDEDENLYHCFQGQTFDIQRYSFLVCDEQGDVIGCRKEFPLKLGYATTVHKAQGRTIPHLNIDCSNFWKAGQMGVALGRAFSKETVQVQNYNTYAATISHPKIVQDFYHSKGKQINF